MPTISLRTVYQTLNDLAAMGELNALVLGTGSTRFDPTVEPHHHMVCDSCGRIVDVHADLPVVPPVAGEGGFTVTATQLVFRGRCAACTTAPADHGSASCWDRVFPYVYLTVAAGA